jgi:hypothetical protein
LHSNEIEIEQDSPQRVAFIPFLGISPYRYRDIFEKGIRKNGAIAKTWYAEDDRPRPMLPKALPLYVELEQIEMDQMEGVFTKAESSPTS